MQDHDLLERAAKAAGIAIQWDQFSGGPIRLNDAGCDVDSWNPLINEDDKRRLADKLGIRSRYERNAPPELGLPRECGVAVVGEKWFAAEDRDPDAAERRAVVLAAASLATV